MPLSLEPGETYSRRPDTMLIFQEFHGLLEVYDASDLVLLESGGGGLVELGCHRKEDIFLVLAR